MQKKERKPEWVINFASDVRRKMEIFGLTSEEMAKVIGVTAQTFNYKLRNPLRLTVKEFCVITDFLHIDRAAAISGMVARKS